MTLIEHAIRAAVRAGVDEFAVTTDIPWSPELFSTAGLDDATRRRLDAMHGTCRWLSRPAELVSDSAPMIAVVQHALAAIPGPPEQIVVLLQPTQPFRTPEHIRKAITLLQETGADAVVSVVPLPLTHSPDFQVVIHSRHVEPYVKVTGPEGWWSRVTARQQCDETYIRDGTVYAFWRKTVTHFGTIYGHAVRPLILDPSESCELDTEADWAAVESRWHARHE